METHCTFLLAAGVCATAVEMETTTSAARTKTTHSEILREIFEADMMTFPLNECRE
jgi:hypothetical protein